MLPAPDAGSRTSSGACSRMRSVESLPSRRSPAKAIPDRATASKRLREDRADDCAASKAVMVASDDGLPPNRSRSAAMRTSGASIFACGDTASFAASNSARAPAIRAPASSSILPPATAVPLRASRSPASPRAASSAPSPTTPISASGASARRGAPEGGADRIAPAPILTCSVAPTITRSPVSVTPGATSTALARIAGVPPACVVTPSDSVRGSSDARKPVETSTAPGVAEPPIDRRSADSSSVPRAPVAAAGAGTMLPSAATDSGLPPSSWSCPARVSRVRPSSDRRPASAAAFSASTPSVPAFAPK